MKFVIITGLSGAGKSQAVGTMEDLGYYCVDNIPPALLTKFAEICLDNRKKTLNVALVMDVRGGEMFAELIENLKKFAAAGYKYEILFLEAGNDILIKRYKESRRKHPLLDESGSITDAIENERRALSEVRKLATNIIDTSNLKTNELRQKLIDIYVNGESFEGLIINVVSFGFKHGILMDADLVFDVRFLPNPFYISELKSHTGKESCVSDYVLSFKQSKQFLGKLIDMLEFLIPQYIEEGKNQLVIGIGCTGGKHRSVTFAQEVYKALKDNKHYAVVNHRDILK